MGFFLTGSARGLCSQRWAGRGGQWPGPLVPHSFCLLLSPHAQPPKEVHRGLPQGEQKRLKSPDDWGLQRDPLGVLGGNSTSRCVYHFSSVSSSRVILSTLSRGASWLVPEGIYLRVALGPFLEGSQPRAMTLFFDHPSSLPVNETSRDQACPVSQVCRFLGGKISPGVSCYWEARSRLGVLFLLPALSFVKLRTAPWTRLFLFLQRRKRPLRQQGYVTCGFTV